MKINEQIDIPAGLYEDEVVNFLADRYHTTVDRIVQCFLIQEGAITQHESDGKMITLTENEMEILRGLSKQDARHTQEHHERTSLTEPATKETGIDSRCLRDIPIV